MPLLLAPTLLVAVVMLFHIPYRDYMAESHWLLWLLGPATVAFAVPVYENRQLMRRHWLSLSVGVVASVVMAVGSTVLLARWLNLSELLQRSMAMDPSPPLRGGGDPFRGWQRRSTALFVVLTGVIGMAVGESVLTVLAIRSRLGKGAGFGALGPRGRDSQGLSDGQRGGVVSSMVMMIAGMATVLLAPSWAGCSGNSATR